MEYHSECRQVGKQQHHHNWHQKQPSFFLWFCRRYDSATKTLSLVLRRYWCDDHRFKQFDCFYCWRCCCTTTIIASNSQKSNHKKDKHHNFEDHRDDLRSTNPYSSLMVVGDRCWPSSSSSISTAKIRNKSCYRFLNEKPRSSTTTPPPESCQNKFLNIDCTIDCLTLQRSPNSSHHCCSHHCNNQNFKRKNLSKTNRKTTVNHQNQQKQEIKKWIFSLFLIVLMLVNVEACGPGRGGTRRRSPRKLTPLVFKQHIPNVSENTLGASGLNEGPVARNHKRFKELVPNYNQDIIFKDEEGTGADRLMTQRLKEKLNTLAISVMNQWPGVKLRVTEGWDEDGQHMADSLHYEGRAVDITTSDRDRSKYGMLARLAVEAGFDWVYYESRFHIHCSVKSEKSESARYGGCFDESSLVHGRNGSMRIDQLQVGDEILSLNAQGKYEYSSVIMFLDRVPDVNRLYYEFETASGAKITTTPSHLLFVADFNSTDLVQSMDRAEFARDIGIGQYLYSTLGNLRPEGSQAVLDQIVKITTRLGKGAYAPLTANGNVLINNITASCYAVIRSQKLAHLTFEPIRLLHQLIEVGDRISESLHVGPTYYHQQQRRHNDSALVGVHWYARLMYSAFHYLIPSNMLYH